jgi:hypothetical protein
MSYTEQNSPRGSPAKVQLPAIKTYLNSPIESPRGPLSGVMSPRINAGLDMSLMQSPDVKRPLNVSFDTNISKHSHMSHMRLEYKVTVQEVITGGSRGSDDWGIEGYTIPKFNPHLDKPISFKITKSRTRDLISELIRYNKDFPGPKYETAGNLLMKNKMSIYKLPRITTFAEEAKRFEKNPSPG